MLWAACTPNYDATVLLNIQNAGDLCNSLLKPNTETKSGVWPGCVTQAENVDGSKRALNVPGVPLFELLQRIPDNIAVEYVKIDAQGFDLEVMKGLLPMSKKVQVVSLEAMDVEDRSKLLYQGQPLLSEIINFLAKEGWAYVRSVNNQGVPGEVNAFFVSDEQYTPKVDNLAQVLMSNKEGQAASPPKS